MGLEPPQPLWPLAKAPPSSPRDVTLTCSPLLLQNCVHILHLTQSLEKWDEIQKLRVGHVVEPRGHGNLEARTEKEQTDGSKQTGSTAACPSQAL